MRVWTSSGLTKSTEFIYFMGDIRSVWAASTKFVILISLRLTTSAAHRSISWMT